MKTIDRLKMLTDIPCITGFESLSAEAFSRCLEPLCDEVFVNNLGCISATKHGSGKSPKKILIDAHCDRIGLIVTGIDENGFISFSALGGIDERTLPACEVYILGKKPVYGVIGAKPPHLLTNADKKASVKIKNMLIDTGKPAEFLKENISVGDPIMIRAELFPLLGDRVTAGALDNRAGVCALFGLLEMISENSAQNTVTIKLTPGEEMGLHGAYTAASDGDYDLAVTVDTTFARTPGAPKHQTFEIGSGAIICRGPNLHPTYTNRLTALAGEKNIPFDIEVASGSSGTNAWAYQTSGGGIPSVLVSIPLRAMHTTAEVVSLKDIENVSKLLYEIAKGGVFDA